MKWIAESSKNESQSALEDRLWKAADQLRANSGLTAAQYSQPVLGLIFLRFADVRFAAQRAKLEKAASSSRRGSRVDDPDAYLAEGVVYLPPEARFDHLLKIPEGKAVGKAVNDAMKEIEKHNPQLKGVLPASYQQFESDTIAELLKLVASIPADLEGDSIGKVYEYFLGTFAMSEGQQGGEFYTPSSLVRLLVEVIEPFHGKIYDPACGSGGMFVQSARFVAEHKKSPSREIAIYGMELKDVALPIAKMNLAVHGLEGDIRKENSYYNDPHESVGKFDFVLANPPFNVDEIKKERLKTDVGEGKRFPFGLPKGDNGNYIWISLFYSSLNDKGRAGFVMANSASDARSSEQDIRVEMIKDHVVDCIVAVGPNMFFTVTLPCTLWFFDKGKRTSKRKDQVLFIDARNIFRQIDRAHRDWTPAQISFIANVVRLYRGEELDYTLGEKEAQKKIKEIFPKGKYQDVLGLCKIGTLKEIEAQGWSLNPGRYVGVAPGEDVSDEEFKEQFLALNEEFTGLTAQAAQLATMIGKISVEILKS